MTTDDVIAALANMLAAMPEDLRRQVDDEIAAGLHPGGIRLAHRAGHRFEAVYGDRWIGTLIIPPSFWTEAQI